MFSFIHKQSAMFSPLSSIFSCLLIVLLQLSVLFAQNSGSVTIGQSLTAAVNGPTWLSPSGDFAFGFRPLENTNGLFLLAIWYAKIPDTMVWFAYDDGKPISVNKGSTVTLTADQGLAIQDQGGNQLWRSPLNIPGFVGYGFMNDTGNFSLKSRGDNETMWETFESPTDTLLPTQTMGIGRVAYAQQSETNFTQGRFQMLLLKDGNLVLNSVEPGTNYNYGSYYNTGTADASNSTPQLIYNENGSMYILLGNGSKFESTPGNIPSARDYYHRATLTFDGVFTWYYHPRNFTNKNDVWSRTKSVPGNICLSFAGFTTGSGACGYNSICRIGEDQRPICGCPPNYSLLDPSDPYGSCKPDFELEFCGEEGQGTVKGDYTLLQLQGVDWPQSDYGICEPCSLEACQSFCQNDCFCAVAIYERSTNTCWKKRLPLSNGRNDTQETRLALLKVGSGKTPRVRNKLNTVISVLLGGSVIVNILLLSAIGLVTFFIYCKKPYRQYQHVDEGQSRSFREYSNVHPFSYKELEEATNGFTEELGRGAFGTVYKGVIRAESPPVLVAVKKLDRISNDADKEFKTEVNVIGQTHHKNLVRLAGFCKEEDQRLLVYEFMSNGTLADYLFGDLRPSWIERSRIALGIARGLLYLHEECGTQIIHCDIKPQNILLDDNHNARISDFGLAKLLVLNQTQTNTAIRGTKGYVAPEWFRNKPVTVKVDVYSFGVLLLEIICCRKNIWFDISEEERAILTDWAFDCFQSGSFGALVNDDMEALNDKQRLEKFVMVALWCIQEDPNLRPTMKHVLQMLDGVVEVPNPPSPISYSVATQY